MGTALSVAVCGVEVELGYCSLLLAVVVLVMGEPAETVSLTGEVGVGGSIELCESFVRFFFRKPRVGIWRAWPERGAE